jgi:hypothetical protein
VRDLRAHSLYNAPRSGDLYIKQPSGSFVAVRDSLSALAVQRTKTTSSALAFFVRAQNRTAIFLSVHFGQLSSDMGWINVRIVARFALRIFDLQVFGTW